MIRNIAGPVTIASVLAFAFLGCNSILENTPGTLVEVDEAGALPGPAEPGPTPEQPKPSTPDAGQPDSGDKPSPGCPVGQRMCSGACVSLNDPNYGCGDPSCNACPSTHGTMACQANKCVVAACDPGYADCNKVSGDGCEVDLSLAASCGACNAVCAAAAPLCAPAGPTFQCTNGCTPGAPLNCGAVCVDPNTSTNHCGGCNVKCPVVPNSTSTCTAGACGFNCKAQFHACGATCKLKTDPTACGPDCIACPVPTGGTATCVADTCGTKCTAPSHICGNRCVTNDPTACGAACTVCPAPANATATCAAETCGFQCSAGFGNCDMNPANGCETTFATDPLNCGVCGKSCAGQACVNGVCQAAPPPPPP